MKPEEFIKFKEQSGFTWDKLSKELGTCLRTVYCYRDGTNPIPKTVELLIGFKKKEFRERKAKANKESFLEI